MNRSLHIRIISILLIIATITLVSCKPKAILDDSERDLNAQEFMVDLRDNILRYKEDPSRLIENGVLVSENGNSINVDVLDDFYSLYQEDKPCNLTIAFFSQSQLVFAKIEFTPKGGYYFRYVLDEEKDITVSAKHVEGIKLEKDSATGKNLLTLQQADGKVIKFTFIAK